MKLCLLILVIPLFTFCTQMPSVFQSVEDMITDDVVSVSVNRGAMQALTDIKVNIDILNKDQK